MKCLTKKECEQALDSLYDEAAMECYVDEDDGDLICADCTNDDKYLDMREPLDQLIKEHFDNPPLKFNELEEGMWVWDTKTSCYIYIFKPLNWNPVQGIRYASYRIMHSAYGYYTDFEENRFYRREVTDNERD